MNSMIIYAVIVVFLAVAVFLLYRSGLKKQAKQLLLCLVSTAEQTYGSKTGKLKFSAVATKLYELMPTPFKFVFSEKAIAYMIEYAVKEMKELLGERQESSDNAEEAEV